MFPISASTVKEAKQMQIHCQQKLIKWATKLRNNTLHKLIPYFKVLSHDTSNYVYIKIYLAFT
jgi:hypothetical protein